MKCTCLICERAQTPWRHNMESSMEASLKAKVGDCTGHCLRRIEEAFKKKELPAKCRTWSLISMKELNKCREAFQVSCSVQGDDKERSGNEDQLSFRRHLLVGMFASRRGSIQFIDRTGRVRCFVANGKPSILKSSIVLCREWRFLIPDTKISRKACLEIDCSSLIVLAGTFQDGSELPVPRQVIPKHCERPSGLTQQSPLHIVARVTAVSPSIPGPWKGAGFMLELQNQKILENPKSISRCFVLLKGEALKYLPMIHPQNTYTLYYLQWVILKESSDGTFENYEETVLESTKQTVVMECPAAVTETIVLVNKDAKTSARGSLVQSKETEIDLNGKIEVKSYINNIPDAHQTIVQYSGVVTAQLTDLVFLLDGAVPLFLTSHYLPCFKYGIGIRPGVTIRIWRAHVVRGFNGCIVALACCAKSTVRAILLSRMKCLSRPFSATRAPFWPLFHAMEMGDACSYLLYTFQQLRLKHGLKTSQFLEHFNKSSLNLLTPRVEKDRGYVETVNESVDEIEEAKTYLCHTPPRARIGPKKRPRTGSNDDLSSSSKAPRISKREMEIDTDTKPSIRMSHQIGSNRRNGLTEILESGLGWSRTSAKVPIWRQFTRHHLCCAVNRESNENGRTYFGNQSLIPTIREVNKAMQKEFRARSKGETQSHKDLVIKNDCIPFKNLKFPVKYSIAQRRSRKVQDESGSRRKSSRYGFWKGELVGVLEKDSDHGNVVLKDKTGSLVLFVQNGPSKEDKSSERKLGDFLGKLIKIRKCIMVCESGKGSSVDPVHYGICSISCIDCLLFEASTVLSRSSSESACRSLHGFPGIKFHPLKLNLPHGKSKEEKSSRFVNAYVFVSSVASMIDRHIFIRGFAWPCSSFPCLEWQNRRDCTCIRARSPLIASSSTSGFSAPVQFGHRSQSKTEDTHSITRRKGRAYKSHDGSPFEHGCECTLVVSKKLLVGSKGTFHTLLRGSIIYVHKAQVQESSVQSLSGSSILNLAALSHPSYISAIAQSHESSSSSDILQPPTEPARGLSLWRRGKYGWRMLSIREIYERTSSNDRSLGENGSRAGTKDGFGFSDIIVFEGVINQRQWRLSDGWEARKDASHPTAVSDGCLRRWQISIRDVQDEHMIKLYIQYNHLQTYPYALLPGVRVRVFGARLKMPDAQVDSSNVGTRMPFCIADKFTSIEVIDISSLLLTSKGDQEGIAQGDTDVEMREIGRSPENKSLLATSTHLHTSHSTLPLGTNMSTDTTYLAQLSPLTSRKEKIRIKCMVLSVTQICMQWICTKCNKRMIPGGESCMSKCLSKTGISRRVSDHVEESKFPAVRSARFVSQATFLIDDGTCQAQLHATGDTIWPILRVVHPKKIKSIHEAVRVLGTFTYERELRWPELPSKSARVSSLSSTAMDSAYQRSQLLELVERAEDAKIELIIECLQFVPKALRLTKDSDGGPFTLLSFVKEMNPRALPVGIGSQHHTFTPPKLYLRAQKVWQVAPAIEAYRILEYLK